MVEMPQNREMSKGTSSPVIGLTGGIGSGKSTVSAKLAQLGACVIDSDVVAREVVQPGTNGLQLVVDRFGTEVLSDDGSLDRAKLARLVFSDSEARSDLNAILHPLIEREIARQVLACSTIGTVPIVVVIPLLVETNAVARYGFAKVVVVDLPEELAVARVVASRDMTEVEVRERVAAQASREERLAKADYVIDNSVEPAALDEQVAALWEELKALS